MKRFIAILMILATVLSFSGCYAESTVGTDLEADHVYGLGEEMKFFDLQTDEKLGSVTVKEVYVLSDKPFSRRERVGKDEDGESVYETLNFEGIVQICYSYETVDSSRNVTNRNFYVYDRDGNKASINTENGEYILKETEYNSFVVAVQDLDEGLNVGVSFIRGQEPCAWAAINYSDNSAKDSEQVKKQIDEIKESFGELDIEADDEDERRSEEKLKGLISAFIAVLVISPVVCIVLIIVVIVMAVKMKKLKKKVKELEAPSSDKIA